MFMFAAAPRTKSVITFLISLLGSAIHSPKLQQTSISQGEPCAIAPLTPGDIHQMPQTAGTC